MTHPVARQRTVWRRVDGIVLLDKPLGLSSNQALQVVRRIFRAEKAGHTGSLDPMATGVLPLCFGEATKVAGLLLDADKRYVATLSLGQRTATGDREGAVVEERPVPPLSEAVVRAALEGFLGDSQQVPPMYSALKRDGEPLYELARRGEVVDRAPRPVHIRAIDLLDWAADRVTFDVRCSKGTYVRTLGEDLAAVLGTVGHLSALRRTDVGGAFSGIAVHTLDSLQGLVGQETVLDGLLLAPDAALTAWPRVSLDDESARRLMHGQVVPFDGLADGVVRAYGPEGRFLGLVDAQGSQLVPKRLFN